MRSRRLRGRTAGGSLVECSLLLPWVLFLFVGAFDWGFYAHALISTENSVRVAAIYAANLSSGAPSFTTACNLVLGELSIASNVSNLNTCTNGTTVTNSAPVAVQLTCTSLDSVQAVKVSVVYQTLQLIPIPGLLEGQATLYRTVEMPMSTSSCSVGS